jgi:hypothetical protein
MTSDVGSRSSARSSSDSEIELVDLETTIPSTPPWAV